MKDLEDKIMSMDIYEQWAEQRRTDAHMVYEDLYASIFMSHINQHNYKNLNDELNKYASLENAPEKVIERGISRQEFMYVTQLFANYISTAVALKDATRNITKIHSLFSAEEQAESSERLQRDIIANPVTKLVEELRNFIIHKSIIVPVMSFEYRNSSLTAGFAFKKDQLLSYKRFTAPSKEYLRKMDGAYLYLLPLLETYNNISSTYQAWILNTALARHKSSNHSYWKVRSQISEEWGGDLSPYIPF